MKADRFVKAHRAGWKRLDELASRAANKGVNRLSNEELHEMGALYRRASADLARAQTRFGSTNAGRELVRSLNDLVLRAHTQVYSAPAQDAGRGWSFLIYGFPAAVRRQWRPIAIAAMLLYGPSLLAYVAVLVNPDMAKFFVPDSAIAEVQKRAQTGSSAGWGANTQFSGLLESPAVSSFIMTNNIKVTIMAVALGVTMGIGTSFVLIQNGLMLGGLSGVATNNRVDLLFWAVILPHGILELSAIAIAGGAGFVLARALYAPGTLPRRDALKVAGAEAARLLLGVAALLVCAGLIEGFITPQPVSPFLKLGFAALTAVGLGLYLMARPRSERLRG